MLATLRHLAVERLPAGAYRLHPVLIETVHRSVQPVHLRLHARLISRGFSLRDLLLVLLHGGARERNETGQGVHGRLRGGFALALLRLVMHRLGFNAELRIELTLHCLTAGGHFRLHLIAGHGVNGRQVCLRLRGGCS